ncbi:MAG TPA: CinA family protein [Pseudomonadales bacterium]|nr:CinA family protein [Pseudomonadales bacterium]
MAATSDQGEGADSGTPSAEALAARLGDRLAGAGLSCVTAESCTGGGIAWTCTAVPGASAWFHGAFVTYAVGAKVAMLGVPAALVDTHGAVSEPVARAMVEGALAASGVDLALAVTGAAGPGGGDVLVPVGTVWFAWMRRGDAARTAVHRIPGDRGAVRTTAVRIALAGALALLEADGVGRGPS